MNNSLSWLITHGVLLDQLSFQPHLDNKTTHHFLNTWIHMRGNLTPLYFQEETLLKSHLIRKENQVKIILWCQIICQNTITKHKKSKKSNRYQKFLLGKRESMIHPYPRLPQCVLKDQLLHQSFIHKKFLWPNFKLFMWIDLEHRFWKVDWQSSLIWERNSALLMKTEQEISAFRSSFL